MIDENIEKLTNDKPEDSTAVNDGVIHYVPGDIGIINVDEIVGKLGYIEGTYYVMYICCSLNYLVEMFLQSCF